MPFVLPRLPRGGPARSAASPRPLERGFTLVELAVVMAIVGILTAAVLPSMQAYVSGRAVDAMAQELVTTLRLARSEALKRGMEVSVCAGNLQVSPSVACANSTAWAAGWVAFADQDSNGAMGNQDAVVRVHHGQGGVQSATSSARSITLARSGFLLLIDGAAVSADSSVSYVIKPLSGSDQAARTVCLNRLGRVSISRGVNACT